MKFYCINRKGANPTTIKLLKKSAKERNIEFKEIYSDCYEFIKFPNLKKVDILYNICIDHKSKTLEKCIINNNVTTFCVNNNTKLHSYDNVIDATIIHTKNNLPIIKTVFDITKDRKILKKYIKFLDGFPIIIKSMGGSHGIGVIKIDSYDSLLSVIDVLLSNNNKFIMRKFINYKEHARLIVLGDKVISSIEYKKIKDDFRSNVGKELKIKVKNFGKEIENTAIKAVEVLGYEFGGVDILLDNKGGFYIAEVNYPCFFPRAQEVTGVDISGLMIDYLVKKQKITNTLLYKNRAII